MHTETKDTYGNVLAQGDTVLLTKDLKVKGTSVTLKKGMKIKNIHLTDTPTQIEANAPGAKGLVLLTEFVKKG